MVKKTKQKIEEKKIDNEDNSSKQLGIIIGIMLGVIILILATPWIYNMKNTFKYENMTFTKQKFGEIDVFHYYYYYVDRNSELIKYNLYLRNDPRKNDIPVRGKIEFNRDKTVYVSVNSTGLAECPMASLAISSISRFLIENDLNIKGATNDKVLANQTGVEYAVCGKDQNGTIITIEKNSDITDITARADSCYLIRINKCEEFLPAIEKFMVQSIIDAKE